MLLSESVHAVIQSSASFAGVGCIYWDVVVLETASLNVRHVQIMKYSEQKYFFYLAFLSKTFKNHRAAGKGGWHLFNSSLHLSPVSQTLSHLAGWLLQRAHLCTWPMTRFELGTLGFWAKVANPGIKITASCLWKSTKNFFKQARKRSFFREKGWLENMDIFKP